MMDGVGWGGVGWDEMGWDRMGWMDECQGGDVEHLNG